jgi:hypothetical protein
MYDRPLGDSPWHPYRQKIIRRLTNSPRTTGITWSIHDDHSVDSSNPAEEEKFLCTGAQSA